MQENFVEEVLKIIREKGIAVALDDFGKEYSSISYLRNLSLDTLKIDKAFIDDIKDKNDESSIIDIIIGVAKKWD